MKVITTIPPYAPFLPAIAKVPIVSGFRLNTVMPVSGSLSDMLKRLKSIVGRKQLWIDLKCRQIRISRGDYFKAPTEPRTYTIGGTTYVLDPSQPRAFGHIVSPPWATIKIDRKIKLDVSRGPVKCWFQDGKESASIVEVINGDELIMLDGPQRIVGGGESINITDPSLEVEGYLTDLDVQYVEAARALGIHTYMLSYVEQDSDITDLLALDPDAHILAKIESRKGLQWVQDSYSKHKSAKVRLMAARGDLFVEVGRPDRILNPLKDVVAADAGAVLASRIFNSLVSSPHPSCADVTDIACMLEMGYRHFMIGDDICFHEESLLLALDILQAIDRDYRR